MTLAGKLNTLFALEIPVLSIKAGPKRQPAVGV